jgi:threonine synthase
MGDAGGIEPGAAIVCVMTGHGLKDPDTAARTVTPAMETDASADAIRHALDW